MKRDQLTKRLKSAINWIQKYRGLIIWVIVISVAVILFRWGINYSRSILAPHLNKPDNIEGIKALISLLSTLATTLAGILVFWNVQIARRNTRQGEEKLITERFSKAVEQLGSDKIEVRLGGIYSLERIAKDSPKDHWTIMEVLTAFIREKCPLEPESSKETPKIATDVQAALTVIGRRIVEQDPTDHYLDLDLSSTNLRRANLMRASLKKANLFGSDFKKAFLFDSDLSEAVLNFTDLSEANLSEANLIKTKLSGANLSEANLSEAVLSAADLKDVDLREADLSRTYFREVPTLGKVKNLTPEQVKSAKNWEQAYYDPDFRQQLGLPPQ